MKDHQLPGDAEFERRMQAASDRLGRLNSQRPTKADNALRRRLQRAADIALDQNMSVYVAGFAVVPDVLMLELCAQGHDERFADTWVLRRDRDGRSVHIYLPGVE